MYLKHCMISISVIFMSSRGIVVFNAFFLVTEVIDCFNWFLFAHCVVTHASIDTGMGRAFSRVCLFVRALTERLELSAPNLVHIYNIAVARHALTQRSKGQGHMVRKLSRWRDCLLPCPVFRTLVHHCATCGRCRRGFACWFDCLCFLVVFVSYVC